MVERYTLTSLDEVGDAFGVAVPADLGPRFNIAPLQRAPIRSSAGLTVARWGLLPPWRGHGGKRGPHVLHAPVDDIEQVPLLRNAFKSQRCLVIADGFFVWRRSGKKPQPYWVHPTPDPAQRGARSRAIAFAGLAATHRDDGQLSFAIIVGPASPLVAPMAPTMPLVVPAAGYTAWLSGTREEARELLATPAEGSVQMVEPLGSMTRVAWRADPVSTWVNSVEHDDPKCIESTSNTAQGELF
jgi:putative SOS response-associated peptidase YedK